MARAMSLKSIRASFLQARRTKSKLRSAEYFSAFDKHFMNQGGADPVRNLPIVLAIPNYKICSLPYFKAATVMGSVQAFRGIDGASDQSLGRSHLHMGASQRHDERQRRSRG